MQNFPPEIKQLLTDWYLLTLENPFYAGALVVSVWLLAVLFYSIRIYFANKKQRATEQQTIKVQGMLDEAQQQKKQSEEELTAITEKLAKEQQLASEFAVKVEQRNQQIVDNIKQLANKFDLSEQLVATAEKPKAEFVWQQQDNILLQLTEKLQVERQEKHLLQETYKQEKEQFSKQEALIVQLQKIVDIQTNKSLQLEQDLNAQRLILQEQKTEAEQKLTDKLAEAQKKHELDIASLANKLNQQSVAVGIDTEDQTAVETDVLGDAFQETISETTNQIKVNTFEPEVKEKTEGLTAKIEPEIVSNESIPEVLDPTVSDKTVEQEMPALIPGVEEDVKPDYTKSNLDITGKFKGLFAKEKKQVAKPEPEQSTEILAAKELLPEVEAVVEEPDYIKSNLDITGKFKGLFGKEKRPVDTPELGQQDDIPVPKQQTEVLMTTSREPELEDQEFEPDYTKSNIKIPGRVKKLFTKKS